MVIKLGWIFNAMKILAIGLTNNLFPKFLISSIYYLLRVALGITAQDNCEFSL